MKVLLIYLGLLGSFSISYGSSQKVICSKELLDEVPAATALEICKTESLARDYDQLNRWISESEKICTINAPYEKDKNYYSKCIDGILVTSRASLVCEESPDRFKEVVKVEEAELVEKLKANPQTKTPRKIQKVFNQLTAVVDTHYSFSFDKPHWKLIVFKADFRNATASVDGTILLSENFWQGKKRFSTGEIAGILSHEIAHVILRHYMRNACLALSWVGHDTTLKDAFTIMNEEGGFMTTSGFGKARTKLTQNYEFEADNLATFILSQAGMDSNLMGKALIKLKPKTSGGFSTGSHPGFDERIKRVLSP